MKKAVLSLVLIALCTLTIAQAPEYFNYQVVVRDGVSNNPLTNQDVSFKMSVLKGSTSGESQYSEVHSANTGDLGIVNLVIGNGTGKTGNLTTIDWGADTYFLKVEIDKTGGSSFVGMGTTQLLSVPYSLYAKEAKTSSDGVKYLDGTQSVIGNDSPVINTGTRNIFLGKSSGMTNTSGTYNTFIGSDAGYFNTIGINNIAIGKNALRENDEGSENIAIGTNALEKNKIGGGGTGSDNVAIGTNALRNSISHMNVAIGGEVLQSLTDGGANTGIGEHVMRDLVNGSSNTAVGYTAMINATGNASSNVALGVRSGTKIKGLGNVFVGHESGIVNIGSQNVFIGFLSGYGDTWKNVSNRLIIHNGFNNIVDVPLIYGEFDNSKVVINGSLKATNGIDATDKTITNILNPVNPQDAATKAYVDNLLSIIQTIQVGVNDLDGNRYKVIIIGDQIWMAENLKTTKYNDGTPIPLVTDNTAWSNLTTPGYCWYDNSESNKETYGAMYNWHTVNTRILCPTGWHVPSDAEWTTMENYLISNGFNYDGTITGNKTGKAVATTSGWASSSTTGAVGNTDYPSKRNATGFTALPGGLRYNDGAFNYIGYNGIWWSATEYDAANAWFRNLSYSFSNLDRPFNYKEFGFSVRCIKDQ